MLSSMETTIELPDPIMEKIIKFAEFRRLSQQEAIIQLLDLALSQESRKLSSKGKSLPDSMNDDCR